MKRREFFASATSLLLPVVVNGYGVKSLSPDSSFIKSFINTATAAASDRILVIIYLNGGNDGLNTVIPLEYYSRYYNLRSNIALPENQVLSLSGNSGTGLHPAMTGMRDMFNNGKLAIINAVSYPNPNKSHYRSSDIWMSAVESNQYENSGWAGRYLDNRFPGYPANYPNDQIKDPLALQIGILSSQTLTAQGRPLNISLENVNSFYQLAGSSVPTNDLPCCDAGDLISYIREQQVLTIGYSAQIKRAADLGKNLGTYPTATSANDLSEQLKIVARLINGGLQTKIYFVEMGGFDTHAGQVSGANNLEGSHANLLKKLSDGISAFQNDMDLLGISDKVIGMTFSDFGRRASSNASKGTDHGIAAPMFVFGTGVKRQFVGSNPDLLNDLEPPTSGTPTESQDVKMQVDFRRIYSDILKDWFGTDTTTTNALLFKSFKTTSLFSNVIETVSSGAWLDRNIWSAGYMPGPKDYVKINSGHTITLGQNITVRNIQVESGAELRFLGNYNVDTTG